MGRLRPLYGITAIVTLLAVEGTSVAERAPDFERQLGKPIRVSDLGKPGALVIDWIAAAYGRDADQVPVYLLGGDQFAAVYRSLGGQASPMNVSVDGFAFKGHVFVKRGGLFGLSAKTLTHEVLHVLSSRFSSEAQGRRNLVEGMTEFFTVRATPPERVPRSARLRRSTYRGYVQFVEALAAAVGTEELARCFFDEGYRALERLVDRRLGKGRLRRAARYLELDDIDGALAALQ